MKKDTQLIKYSVCLLLLLSIKSDIFAQKNGVYATAGIYYSLSYERVLHTTDDESKLIYARFHGGNIPQLFYASDDSFKYRHVGLSLGLLVGKSNRKFECNFGAGHIWTFKEDGSSEFVLDDKDIIPNVNIGYRHQTESTVFRIGVGVPELLYISLGFRF